jgi:succinyl-CoA synthetase beta subunit
MARQKLSEFKAKKLLLQKLKLPYSGLRIAENTSDVLNSLDKTKKFVVKVDEGVKKRFKQGLVKLDISFEEIKDSLQALRKIGYSDFLIEEYQEHSESEERYLAIERRRDGIFLLYSLKGGVDIEEYKHAVNCVRYEAKNTEKVATELGVTRDFLDGVVTFFEEIFASFLEINPLVIQQDKISVLDLAIEVDSAGEFFTEEAWTEDDIVFGSATEKTVEEEAVDQLSSKSQASFRLVVLNPNGSIFMLLSGGGASIVVADEVHNQKKGKELANYGEYSGNPSEEETYLYTLQILSLMNRSTSLKKVLIIAGGVANFTDIRVTFKGIIRALEENKMMLTSQQVKVYVRRGGPYQQEGLDMMKDYLEKENLLGDVTGPEVALTKIVSHAVKEIQ